MIIDTEILREKLSESYTQRCKHVDENTRDNMAAKRRLTMLEMEEMYRLSDIMEIEQLANELLKYKGE